MTILTIALGCLAVFVAAYHTYGRWLARRVFRLRRDAPVPSVELRDDVDYCPTRREIVFGHHFTSIAGTGPIVGPAIAIMWGWVPALLWIVFGSVFIGAVHDLGALVVSLRNRGQTVGDIAGRLITPRTRLLFLCILFLALLIVLAIFGLVIAAVFRQFPASILPVFLQIPIAVAIGLWLHRRGVGLFVPSLIALVLMYATVWLGAGCPGTAGGGGALGEAIRAINALLASWPNWVWVGVLLVYCYVASVLPVWVLLQPRDYINSLQLISSLGLVLVGVIVAGLAGAGGRAVEMVAPAFQLHPLNAPPIWPVLFITIACGAVSGFHCLVSSGTSSKQLRSETDAQFVGYGAMLTEGFLAVLVVLAVGAGIGLGWPERFGDLNGSALWSRIYHDWHAAQGLSMKVGAFVAGAANFLEAYGIDHGMAVAIMGVLVASFAGTTLDTACRLQRYVVQELASAARAAGVRDGGVLRVLGSRHGATSVAVISAALVAIWPPPGKPFAVENFGQGGQILWPLFGATNQLLAGLAFLVVVFYLLRRNQPAWFIALPMGFMLLMPAWAMVISLDDFLEQGSWLLAAISAATLVLEAWMVIEALALWPKVRGVLEPPLPAMAAAPRGGGSEAGRSC